MASKVYENEHYSSTLVKSIQAAREGNQYLDVTFTVGSRKISAHKLVMCGLSEYFKNILQMDAKDSNDITLKEVNCEAFEMLVNYAYTGKIEIQSENVYKLLQSSDYFQVTFVKSACEAFLAKQLDLRIKQLELETWLELFFMSETYSLANLKELCFVYLAELFEEIYPTDSFLNIPVDILREFLRRDKMAILRNNLPVKAEEVELILYRGVLRYASLNKEINNENVRKLLRSIRYNCIVDKKESSELKKWPKMMKHKEMKLLHEDIKKGTLDEISNVGMKRQVPVIQIFKDKAYCAYGGNLLGGRYFSSPDNVESLDVNIVHIKLWIRSWDGGKEVLGSIALKYTSGLKCRFGGPTPGYLHISQHVINLDEGEYITQVKGRHGWLVDNLHFITNKGREFGPFGGNGGRPFECKHTVSDKPVFLQGFCGEVCDTQGSESIKNFGFIWKYYQRE